MRIKEIMNKSYFYVDETPNFEIRQSIWRIQILSLGRRKRVTVTNYSFRRETLFHS